MIVEHGLRWHAEYRLYDDSFALFAANREWIDGKQIHSRATSITFERYDPGEVLIHDPLLTCRPEEIQELMDALWKAGVRPTAGKQSEGVTAAQGRHLEDMRALAFAKLKVEQPS